jgi:hypothetical protein
MPIEKSDLYSSLGKSCDELRRVPIQDSDGVQSSRCGTQAGRT